MLSDYSLETKKKHAVSSGKVSKLVTTLMNKENMFYITETYNYIEA